MINRRIYRHIIRAVLLSVGITWLVLTFIDMLGFLINGLEDLGQGNYGVSHLLLQASFQLPRRLYENYPMAAVIGVILAIGGLSARSEITAMRAVGISKVRIGVAGLISVMMLAVPLMIVAETLAPWGDQKAQSISLAAKHDDVILTGKSGLWAREGQEFFNARGASRRQQGDDVYWQFDQVRVYRFQEDGRLQSIEEAGRAEYREKAGWQLHQIRETVFHENFVEMRELPDREWNTLLEAGAIESGTVRPVYLSTANLAREIEQMRRSGQEATKLKSVFWSRLTYPLVLIGLVFAALPFAFGSLRSGGFGLRLFTGIVFALVIKLGLPLLVDLSAAYRVEVWIAYAGSISLLYAFAMAQAWRTR